MSETPTRSTSQSQLLLQVIQDLAEIKAEFRADRQWRERVEQRIEDHEIRVRELEKARWQTAWVTSVASAVLTALIVFLVNSNLGA